MGGDDLNAHNNQLGGSDDLDGFSKNDIYTNVGGKRRRGRRTAKKSRKGKGKKGKSARKSRKGKRGASPWIAHVKAFCKKTGKTFPEALKDPACKKSFKK